jgi:hypothetical protein
MMYRLRTIDYKKRDTLFGGIVGPIFVKGALVAYVFRGDDGFAALIGEVDSVDEGRYQWKKVLKDVVGPRLKATTRTPSHESFHEFENPAETGSEHLTIGTMLDFVHDPAFGFTRDECGVLFALVDLDYYLANELRDTRVSWSRVERLFRWVTYNHSGVEPGHLAVLVRKYWNEEMYKKHHALRKITTMW